MPSVSAPRHCWSPPTSRAPLAPPQGTFRRSARCSTPSTTAISSTIYTDLISTSGGADVITDTLKTPLGDFVIPITFDAAKAETTDVIHLPDGAELTPMGAFDYDGINGLPPEDVSIQGMQAFTYTDIETSGSLNADVTNTLDLYGNTDQTILVTSSTESAIPVGSVFETVNWADSGFGSVYADIVTAGGTNLISRDSGNPVGRLPHSGVFGRGRRSRG